MKSAQQKIGRELDTYRFGFNEPEESVYKAPRGLSTAVVEAISSHKSEPLWMRAFRLQSYKTFLAKLMPTWGADLSRINFDNIFYYLKPVSAQGKTWEDVPKSMKRTFNRLGIPQAEQKYLAGVGAQYDSEVIYHSVKEKLSKQGVIFTDMDSGLREYPEIVKQYFGKLIPPADNKFAALNSAVWSGGSFVYIPRGVHVEMPLQAYFRINAKNMGQFERTLIVAEEGSSVHYVEGCLPAGEQVSTGKQWVNIESIKPGDTVLNSDGQEANVSAIRTRPFKGDMLTIKPLSAGNAFQLTPEHPVLMVARDEVLVKRKSRKHWLGEASTERLSAAKPRFTQAGQLHRGDFLVFPIPQVTREKRRYTKSVMRLLGYYLAEGSTYIHKTLRMPVVVFSFGATESDRPCVEETKRLIQELTGKRAIEVLNRKNHGVSVVVYSQVLRDLCLESCGKGAATKILSQSVMELPIHKQVHLLETYFLGDGSRYQRASVMMRATTVSLTLARQTQELLARQGHYATISVRKGGPDTILGRRIVRRDQYITYYSPDKKMGEVRRQGKTFLVPIKTIERSSYNGPVFNIELDRTPNAYLARGFAVHNCTAPIYASDSLHAAVVEIFVKKGARVRYTTIQNWSKDVYNLVTKRARVEEEGVMEWIDGNLGSRITMKYPSVYLVGRKAHGEVLSLAFAGAGQHQDAGGKAIHVAPETTSLITSKSISKNGGRTSYRGLLHITPQAEGSRSTVRCDALILDDHSRSDTYPTMRVRAKNVTVGHEATVSKIGDEQLFYLRSRGLTEPEASAMVVNGFIEPIVKTLPLEYAIELNRLILMEMEGSVG